MVVKNVVKSQTGRAGDCFANFGNDTGFSLNHLCIDVVELLKTIGRQMQVRTNATDVLFLGLQHHVGGGGMVGTIEQGSEGGVVLPTGVSFGASEVLIEDGTEWSQFGRGRNALFMVLLAFGTAVSFGGLGFGAAVVAGIEVERATLFAAKFGF